MKRVPAPIDAKLLDPVLVPEVATCRTLPAEAYVSDAVFSWERDHLFRGTWVCAGRAPEPGSIAAVEVANESILLSRDEGGGLRAFYNVCRHRGHELLRVGERRKVR